MTSDLSRALAVRVLARWRVQGYAGAGVDPTGFCYPVEEDSVESVAERGDAYYPLGARAAVDAVASAIRSGGSYAFRELGEVRPVPFAALAALEGTRVLVVDDRADTRELLVVALETCGASVEAAAAAAEALAALRRGDTDVLVSDLMMPGEDGFALIRQARTLPPERGGSVPAVALSALTAEQAREAAEAAGFDAYLEKPVEIGPLVETIVELITRGQQ